MTSTSNDAIEHALLAVLAARGGDERAADTHLATAKGHARATARRERQVVEMATLVIAGDAARAAGLALEHAAEFPADATLMERISTTSAPEQRRGSQS